MSMSYLATTSQLKFPIWCLLARSKRWGCFEFIFACVWRCCILHQNVSSNYQFEACLKGPGGVHAPPHAQAWAGLVLKFLWFQCGNGVFCIKMWTLVEGGLSTKTPWGTYLGQWWLIFLLMHILLPGALTPSPQGCIMFELLIWSLFVRPRSWGCFEFIFTCVWRCCILHQNVNSNYQSETYLKGPGGAYVQAWAGLVLNFFWFQCRNHVFCIKMWILVGSRHRDPSKGMSRPTVAHFFFMHFSLLEALALSPRGCVMLELSI